MQKMLIMIMLTYVCTITASNHTDTFNNLTNADKKIIEERLQHFKDLEEYCKWGVSVSAYDFNVKNKKRPRIRSFDYFVKNKTKLKRVHEQIKRKKELYRESIKQKKKYKKEPLKEELPKRQEAAIAQELQKKEEQRLLEEYITTLRDQKALEISLALQELEIKQDQFALQHDFKILSDMNLVNSEKCPCL